MFESARHAMTPRLVADVAVLLAHERFHLGHRVLGRCDARGARSSQFIKTLSLASTCSLGIFDPVMIETVPKRTEKSNLERRQTS